MSNSTKIIAGVAGAILIVVVIILVVPRLFGDSEPEPFSNATKSNILPFGNNLDFTQVKKYNSDKKLFNYPTTSPIEVGKPINNILQ